MMRENQRLLNQLHVFTDGLAVFLAMLVSYWLRFSLFRGVRGMPLNYYIWLGVVAAALTLAVFAVAGLYESFRTVRFHVEASRVAALARRAGVTERVCMSGGVAKNSAVRQAISEELGVPVSFDPLAQYFGAIGAALWAYKEANK